MVQPQHRNFVVGEAGGQLNLIFPLFAHLNDPVELLGSVVCGIVPL